MIPPLIIDPYFKFSVIKMDTSNALPNHQVEDLSGLDFDLAEVCSDLFKRLGYQQRENSHIFRVFAPSAKQVSLSFKYEGKDRPFLMKCVGNGLWQLELKVVSQPANYQYLITTEEGAIYRKIDPFSISHGKRFDPFFQHESVTSTLDVSAFHDEKWEDNRATYQTAASPLLIYRISPYHFKKVFGSHHLGFRNIFQESIDHLTQCGVSHILIEDLLDHINPRDLARPWSLFHTAKEMGTSKQLQEMINKMHNANMGVMMKIPLDQFDPIEFGLSCYDGKALFHDEKKGYGKYNFASTWTQSYILSAICFWIEYFHMDGFVITAPEPDESSKSIDVKSPYASFVKFLTEYVKKHHPGVLIIEETSPLSSSKKQRLTFDTKEEHKLDSSPEEKLQILTLPSFGAPLDDDLFIRSYTLELTKMFTMQGIKMFEMGQELGQITPWQKRVDLSLQDGFEAALDWSLATQVSGSIILQTCKKLQELYKTHKALYPDALMKEIITTDPSILAFTRETKDGAEKILCIHNHSTKKILIEDIKEISLADYHPLFCSIEQDDPRYLPATSSTLLICQR